MAPKLACMHSRQRTIEALIRAALAVFEQLIVSPVRAVEACARHHPNHELLRPYFILPILVNLARYASQIKVPKPDQCGAKWGLDCERRGGERLALGDHHH